MVIQLRAQSILSAEKSPAVLQLPTRVLTSRLVSPLLSLKPLVAGQEFTMVKLNPFPKSVTIELTAKNTKGLTSPFFYGKLKPARVFGKWLT
jgi:hypothetical protein